MTRTLPCCLFVALLSACGQSETPPSTGPDGCACILPDAGAPGADAASLAGPDAAQLAGPDAAQPGPDAGPIDSPPTISLEDFPEFTTLKNAFPVNVKASDDLGLTRVELFIGDSASPIYKSVTGKDVSTTLYVPSTTLPEGLTSIRVQAIDSAGQKTSSKTVAAVVCNTGKEVVAASGAVSVPANYDGTTEVDQKHHWTNPTGITKILGVLSWTPAATNPWELGLVVGRGECPHSGKALCNEVFARASPLSVEALPTGADAVTGLHFVHVRPNDAMDHKGGKQAYEVKVFIW